MIDFSGIEELYADIINVIESWIRDCADGKSKPGNSDLSLNYPRSNKICILKENSYERQ